MVPLLEVVAAKGIPLVAQATGELVKNTYISKSFEASA